MRYCSPMRRPSWSSPRAWTSKLSPPPGSGATRRLTLVAASASRRSPILLPVIWVPSRPASGLSFGLNTMLPHRIKRGQLMVAQILTQIATYSRTRGETLARWSHTCNIVQSSAHAMYGQRSSICVLALAGRRGAVHSDN